MGRRRRAVIVAFALLIGLDLLAVGSSLLELDLLDRMKAGEVVGDAEISRNDDRQGAVGLLQTVALIAGAIVFIRWLRLAYRDVDVLAPGLRRYGHGWAIGAWFVPFLNLWRPKHIVNDVWRASRPRRGDTWDPPFLLNLWWAAWIVSNVADGVVMQVNLEQDTIEQLRAGDVAYVVGDLLDASVAVLAILVVRRLSDDLDAMASTTPAPAEPPAYATASVGPPPPVPTSAGSPRAGEQDGWSSGAPERPLPPG